jgi:hypothetical protein
MERVERRDVRDEAERLEIIEDRPLVRRTRSLAIVVLDA